MSARKNLVIVRAGDESLHEQWLAGDVDRNWDLIVNYFGDDPARYRKDDVRRIDSKGPKWPALHDLVQGLEREISAYDRVWFPDDDLRATKAGINLLFEIFEKHDLSLAQPSLTPDSYLGHLITLHNRSFVLRFTNFVEIMAPCFSRDFLQQMLPSFQANLSGWGLDFVWPTKISDWKKVAIVDAVTVCHTRPIGGPNYKHLAAGGKTPKEELAEVFVKYGLTSVQAPFVRGGIDKSGQRLSMHDATARELIDNIMIGYLPEVGKNPQALMTLVRPNLDSVLEKAALTSPAIAAQPARREKIIAVFLVHHIAAWDAVSGIYEAMVDSADFLPIAITIPFNFNSRRQGIFDGEDDVHRGLEAMGVSHLRFNFQNHAEGLAILKSIKPDVLFRQSPWDPDIPAAYATNQLNFTRLVYTDYGIGLCEDSPGNIGLAYDQELHRRAWMLLCVCDEHKNIYQTRTTHKGVRAVVTGYPKFDKLVERGRDRQFWPIESDNRQFRLIWAPHHSVRAEHLGFGTFPFVYREILQWVTSHPDVDVVLKPHPMLFDSCAHGLMTKDAVDSFLAAWNALPNTAFVTGGDYGPLFAASDAMLTDGITFLAEYQLFPKPLIWLDSGRHLAFNTIGKKLLRGLHAATSASAALKLVDEVRKQPIDPLQDKRVEVMKTLMPYPGKSAQHVLGAIQKELRA
jgi:hypothetical protein